MPGVAYRGPEHCSGRAQALAGSNPALSALRERPGPGRAHLAVTGRTHHPAPPRPCRPRIRHIVSQPRPRDSAGPTPQKPPVTELFAPVPVTLPWDDPRPAETPVEAKHRRPRTYNLLVAGRERKAINRNYFNSYVWKPALAAAGVIAPLEEGSADGARVR